MNAVRNHLFIFLVVFLSACSSFVAPQNLEQRIAYAQGQVGAAYQTVADLTTRKQISKEKAKETIVEIDKADMSVKLARKALKDGLFKDAESSLQAATSLLLVIEGALK